MDFVSCLADGRSVLMEGALGERLKREHQLASTSTSPWPAWSMRPKGGRRSPDSGASTPTSRSGTGCRSWPPRRPSAPTENGSRPLATTSPSSATTSCCCAGSRSGAPRGCASAVSWAAEGDAYRPTAVLPAAEARSFHSWQADLFAQVGAEFLYAGIMPALPEAVGMAPAMGDSGLPYIVSFMVRGDGRLLDGVTIHDAIQTIDDCVDVQPECYMTNCVHPAVLYAALSRPCNSTELVRGPLSRHPGQCGPLEPGGTGRRFRPRILGRRPARG